MSFWENVDLIVKEKGLTRKSFAEKCGFDVSFFSKGISRKSTPQADFALRIANELNVPLEKLLGVELSLVQKESELNKKSSYHMGELLYKYTRTLSEIESLSDSDRKIVLDLIHSLSEKKNQRSFLHHE